MTDRIAKKQLLNDVVIMRLLLIVLLIIYHSFAPFCGNWPMVEGGKYIIPYRNIAFISYGFFLEAFVFISGVVAGFQFVNRPDRKLNAAFILRKAKRLIIPSIIFSLIYLVVWDSVYDIPTILLKAISGYGHLWFLPMLFMCFVGLWLISKLNWHPLIITAITFLLSLYYWPILCYIHEQIGYFMQMLWVAHYLFFFIVGYYISTLQLKEKIIPRLWVIILLWIVFLTCVSLSIHFQLKLAGVRGYAILLLKNISGLAAAYLMILKYVPANKQLPPLLINLSKYAFGIYIMQEFILQALYYHTSLSLKIDYILLPWIGVATASVLSVVFTHFTLKTRIGRFLIG